MQKHPACVVTRYGWVDIDNENFIIINCVMEKLHIDIFESNFFKEKERHFWPKVQRIYNYESNYGKALAYYKTDFIHHIIRYPEFTPLQFKEALLFVCNVCEYCEKHNLWLRTHLWNVTYYKGNPYIIDIRDFEKYNGQSWKCIFMGHLNKNISHHCPINASCFIENYNDIYDNLTKCKDNLLEIKKILELIKPVEIKNGKLSTYHHTRTDFLYTNNVLNDKVIEYIKNYDGGNDNYNKSSNLFNLLDIVKPKTVIEIGCNNGLYIFGCSKYCPSIGIDYEIERINEANNLNSKFKSQCNFIYLDVLDNNKMNKNYGPNDVYGTVYDRFKSHTLIAPAIIHHLYQQCKSTNKIIEIFSKLAKNYMIIEQIPNNVPEIELEKSLQQYNWKVIKILDSTPLPRKWLLCEFIL
jgi:hypothetical protein